MKRAVLGSSGLEVSELCLGTMTFGDTTDEGTAHKMLDSFVAAGGNFIDTADVYSGGQSEQILGNWLKDQDRGTLVIATKHFWGGPGDNGLSRASITAGIAKSLERLQTDYVDLYQIHCWDALVPVGDWLATMKDLVQQGKVKSIGVSNVSGWQLMKILMTAKQLGIPVASVQCQYSLLCRQPEWELLECCWHESCGFLSWSPLKGGWLTGKFKRDAAPDTDSRVGKVEAGTVKKLQSNPSYSQFADDGKVWELLDAMAAVAAAHKVSVTQVAIRWNIQRAGVTSCIIGVRTEAQLADNLGAASTWELTQDEMDQLNALSHPETPYPYEMVWRLSAKGSERVDGNLWPVAKM